MTSQIGIFGTSGMAREAGDIAASLELEPIFIAQNKFDLPDWSFSAQIVLEKDVGQFLDIPFVVAIAETKIRKSIVKRFEKILRFTNLIHPSSTFGLEQREVFEMCEGAIVAAGARFTSGIKVGDFCIFNQNVTIAHDCNIGNYVHIAPGANISGNVNLQDGCWIGAGAVVNQGCRNNKLQVGESTIVGSGAVVIKNCEPNAIYVGVPAQRLK